MMHTTKMSFLLTCLLVIQLPVMAQENTEPTKAANADQAVADDKSSPVQASRAGANPISETAKPTAKPPASYNPSEEISDDLSVSFPVDI